MIGHLDVCGVCSPPLVSHGCGKNPLAKYLIHNYAVQILLSCNSVR